MLSGAPIEVHRNGDASKAVFFHRDLSLLSEPILKTGPQQGEDEARNVYGCRGNEVMPMKVSAFAMEDLQVSVCTDQEVRV